MLNLWGPLLSINLLKKDLCKLQEWRNWTWKCRHLGPKLSLSIHSLIMCSSFVWNYQFWYRNRLGDVLRSAFEKAAQSLFVSSIGHCQSWKSDASRHRSSEHVTISWLSEFLVVDHLVFDSNQDLFESVRTVPVGKHVELMSNGSVTLVDAWQVDLWVELKCWWMFWVAITADDLEHVDTVVKVGVWWTNDGSIPVCKWLVITVSQTIWHTLIT